VLPARLYASLGEELASGGKAGARPVVSITINSAAPPTVGEVIDGRTSDVTDAEQEDEA